MVRDAAGEIEGTAAFLVDITERKRAEALASRLAAIVTSTDDAIIGTDANATITSWNDAAERIYGYRAGEAIGRNVAMLLLPGQREQTAAIRDGLPAGERVERLETVRRHKNGHHVAVSLTISSIRDTAGAVIGVSTIARDITQQQAMAEQLRASEELYRATVEHAPIGIGMVSLDGRWVRANRALCDMTGYSESELQTRSFQQIIHPDDVAASLDLARRLMAGEIDRVETDRRYLRADGSLLWVHVSVALVRDRTGQPTHRVVQILDISRQKHDQERLLAVAREREALRAIATLVASEAPPDAVFAAAAEHVADVLHGDFAAITRLEPTGQARLIGSWSAPHLPLAPTGLLVDLRAPTAVAHTLRTGQLANRSRYDEPVHDEPLHDEPLHDAVVPVRSGLAAPIEVNGKLWGAVSVGWETEAAVDPQAPERIGRIADLVSLAVAGAQVRQQLTRAAQATRLESHHRNAIARRRLAP